jgi:HlyD family secretion protein
VGDQFVQTEVELGATNEKYVEVLKGVSEGDVVAMSPMSLMNDEEKRTAFGSGSKGGKRDWGDEGSAEADAKGAPGAGPPGAEKKVVGIPGKGDAAGKGGVAGKGGDPSKAKAKRKGGFGGGQMPAWAAKFKNISPEDREQMKTASAEEKAEILKKAGFTEEEIQQASQMRRGGGGGGGRRGGGGGPPGGGGSGGPEQ